MFIVGGLTAAYLLFPVARPWLAPPLWLMAFVTAVEVLVVPLWRYRVHRWETTDKAVYAATGWFVREWRVAPISRIQTVDTEAGPLQQLLGLATVTVTTASAQGPVRIAGLAKPTAVRVAEQLTEIAQVTEGDAT